MDINNEITKSLGPKEAKFIIKLHEMNRITFSLDVASEVTGYSGQSLRNFLCRLVKKGILTSLSNGLYNIVPFELGEERIYAGNPLIIAREIVKRKLKEIHPEYYISHGSAMELHRMVTQPQMIVYTTVTRQIKGNMNILGTRFNFLTCKEKDYFGFKKHWIENADHILVSNIEKTIIDGLKKPECCGGLVEVAKALWIKRDLLNTTRLIDYAVKLGVGAVYRRLGYLLELYKVDCPLAIVKLQDKLTRTYNLLDPTLLKEGKYLARWKLIQNVTDEEFLSVIRT